MADRMKLVRRFLGSVRGARDDERTTLTEGRRVQIDLSTPADEIDAMYESMPDAMLDDSDLGLITDYLTNRLPPDRVAEVRRRLREDETFRKLSAPLVLAWSIRPTWHEEKMSKAEIDQSWKRFAKHAGIVQHRKKPKRRRWLRILLWTLLAPVTLLLLLVGAVFVFAFFYAGPDPISISKARWQEHSPSAVAADGWMPVGNAWVKLDSGAQLFTAAPPGPPHVAKLEGSARILRAPLPGDRPTLPIARPAPGDTSFFIVSTTAGLVASQNGEFRVSTRGDTTDVEVLERRSVPAGTAPAAVRSQAATQDSIFTPPLVGAVVLMNAGESPKALILMPGETGRLLPGGRPITLRALTDDRADENRLRKRMLERIAPRVFQP